MFEFYRNYERIGWGTANQFQQNQILLGYDVSINYLIDCLLKARIM